MAYASISLLYGTFFTIPSASIRLYLDPPRRYGGVCIDYLSSTPWSWEGFDVDQDHRQGRYRLLLGHLHFAHHFDLLHPVCKGKARFFPGTITSGADAVPFPTGRKL